MTKTFLDVLEGQIEDFNIWTLLHRLLNEPDHNEVVSGGLLKRWTKGWSNFWHLQTNESQKKELEKCLKCLFVRILFE